MRDIAGTATAVDDAYSDDADSLPPGRAMPLEEVLELAGAHFFFDGLLDLGTSGTIPSSASTCAD
jgi:hypothetical protein